MFFALVMFMSVIGAVFGQTPATLPYSCDFEAAGDNGWTLKNGTCTNKWHVGSFTSPAGHSGSLFISSDGGTTAGYDVDARSVVVAEKLFQTGTSDSLTIRFDLTIEGETIDSAVYDYLKVFWVPADTVYEASTSWTYYAAKAEYSTNVIMSNAASATNYTVNMLIGTQRMSATIANEPNTLKKLVFVWKNDNTTGTQPGAIIDNISIIATPTHTPTPLPYSCDFEAAGDNGWTLKNGSCANKWYIGQFSMPSGYTKALFISGNNGQTPEYNPDAYSVAVAEKTFQTGTSDSLTISFDLTSEGETNDDGYYVYDYLKVFWVPADTVYEASTSATYYSNSRYSTNVIMSNSPNALNYTLNYSDGEERMSVTIANEPNTLKKLVFVWVNDGSNGSSPGAIIDNISIIATPTPTPTPTPLRYSCDFEAAGDNGWTLKNGSCVNKWAIANYPDATNKVLAITANSTVGYDIDEQSVVVAEKLFQTGTSDSLPIRFSVDVGGEAEPNGYDAWDYLKVFWVPADTVYQASTSIPYYASGEYSTNILTWNNSLLSDEYIFLDAYDGAESVTIANEPNTLKKLVFVWVNDGSNGSSHGAIIDNISIIATPTPLSYSCDFEAAGDNGWTLKNGTSTNQWHVGSFTSPAGHSGSLFISSDGGTTAGYDVNAASVVVAEKLFQTGTSDSLTISFDLTIGGDESSDGVYDYLKVFWVPADTVYEASTSLPYYYADTSYSTNVIMSNAISATNYTVNMLSGTQIMSATIANEPNTLKKLVFVWRNDYSYGTQPGAIIDNIYISDCIIPTDFIASNITQTSAEVSWNGTATGYEVRLNGGTPETVTATSKTFTGLTAGTAYTVEVRAVCESSQSPWVSTSFTTLAASGLADAESGAIKAMIYPNPAKDKATLSLSGLTANAKIIVSDLQGRIIQTEDLQAGTETYELNTSNYASGVYYIRILCGNNVNTQKLIIE